MGFYFVAVLLFASMGAGTFWFIYPRSWFASCGFIVGALVGSEIAINKLARLKFPEMFVEYEYGTERIVEKETCILSLTIQDVSHQIHGLSRDEWCDLADRVIDREFEFTTRSGLGDYYERTRGKLLRVGVLMENSKGGVDVTEIGERFFIQLQKGDYKILDLLPSSARENV